jgi:hypothetical protein
MVDGDRSSPQYRFLADSNSFYHNSTNANVRFSPHLHIAGQAGTGSHVHKFTQNAIMLYDRSCVDDGALPDAGLCIDDRLLPNEYAWRKHRAF